MHAKLVHISMNTKVDQFSHASYRWLSCYYKSIKKALVPIFQVVKLLIYANSAPQGSDIVARGEDNGLVQEMEWEWAALYKEII